MFNFDLKKDGILGINSRNLDYIFASNPRKFYPLVDDKLLTKKLALEAGIKSPELYGVIEYQQQLQHLDAILKEHKDFVIKPTRGSGGGGILLVKGRNPAGFIKGDGRIVRYNNIQYHIGNILNGLYSLGGHSDAAMIEYRIQKIPLFEEIAYQGVPDIRLIIYHGVPVMAMLRLPTHESDGKANLHAGGIGVGLSLRHGITTHAISGNRFIERHSDTGEPLSGIQMPNWDEILDLAVRCNALVGLDYIGVDIVIDRHHGPMLLELNARPGISIQIANRTGLRDRLTRIQRDIDGLTTNAEKIAYAREQFG